MRKEYYKHGDIECIDVIREWGLDFNLGNVLKYICRAGYKGSELEDLIKAKTYLEFEIEDLTEFILNGQGDC